jgi:hypothetical protein
MPLDDGALNLGVSARAGEGPDSGATTFSFLSRRCTTGFSVRP